jgi:hypothetical protein
LGQLYSQKPRSNDQKKTAQGLRSKWAQHLKADTRTLAKTRAHNNQSAKSHAEVTGWKLDRNIIKIQLRSRKETETKRRLRPFEEPIQGLTDTIKKKQETTCKRN